MTWRAGPDTSEQRESGLEPRPPALHPEVLAQLPGGDG